MNRTLSLAALLFATTGGICALSAIASIDRPHIGSSYAVGPESSPVVTRRLIAELKTFPDGLSPTPDGRFLVGLHLETGDVEVRDIATGAVRLLTHMEKPWESGMTDAARVSADGKRVAYNWWEPEHDGRYGLRVIDMDGSHAATTYSDAATRYIWPEAWSPKGDAILAWRNGPDHIMQIVLVPVSGGPVRVLKTLDTRAPRRMGFSPDGRYVAYDHPPRDDSNARDIYVIDLARGTESRVVESPADDGLLGWGPDDGHILFTSDRGGTPGAWLLSMADGKARGAPVLVKPDFWRASPVGFAPLAHSFLYTVQTGGVTLYSVPFDPASGRATGSATALTRTPLPQDYQGGPQFDSSPDGHYVAYGTGQLGGIRTIVIHSLETGESREYVLPATATFLGEVRWLPGDGALLMSVEDKRGAAFLRMDTRTGKFSEAARVADGWHAFLFEPSESGAFIVYQSSRTGAPVEPARIVRQDLRSGTTEVIHKFAPTERPTSRIALSQDGGTIAFTRRVANGTGSELVSMPIGGGASRLIAMGEMRFAGWSRDGRWIIGARRNADETWTIERAGASGGAFEPIGIKLPLYGGRVRWTADGRHIVVGAGRAAEELWTMEKILP